MPGDVPVDPPHDPPGDTVAELHSLVGEMIDAGVRRVHVLGWRDLDDPDAGGSEVHADEFMRRWADAGLDVLHRTSSAAGLPAESERHGYRVIRRGTRYSVFPRAIAAEIARRMGPSDALVEIWNGVPWFSPVWCRRPRITVLHHVHGPMWDQLFPGPFAAVGRGLETRFAPPFYRRTSMVTPSDATKEELVEIGFPAGNVLAVPNGTDPRFRPGGRRSERPSVIAVARLAPVKRFGLLLESVVEARRSVPDLRFTIVGDGPDRAELERRVDELDAHDWVGFTGRVDHDGLVELYQRSWVVASASIAEGWGLSLTEGGGCATPAVATDIRGHRSSVVDGVTGLLADEDALAAALVRVLTDHDLRERLGAASAARVAAMTWDASALGVTRALHAQVVRHRA